MEIKINYFFSLFLLYLGLVSNILNANTAPKTITPEEFNSKVNPSGIAFTENKGQICDQNYSARPDVLFSTTAGKMAVHIRNNGVSYQLYRVDSWKDAESKLPGSSELEKKKTTHKKIDQQTIYRIDLNWLNAKSPSGITYDKTLPGFNNYYLSACPDGALNVKSYNGITLNNIYNGINLHYYESKGQLKHDYVVAPGANYKNIQVEVKGSEVSVNKDGSLFLTTPLGKVQEGAPLVFQNGKPLPAKWVIQNNVLSFDIQNYKPNEELIIDPLTRLWGTYYGGSGVDFVNSCSTDASGNVYLAGDTQSTLNIATSGAHQTTGGAGDDTFLVKFSGAGVLQWGTYYGSSASENAYSCSVDPSGNVYLAGRTVSTVNIATSGAHQTSYGGSWDAFLVKFNSAGVRQWGTYYGDSDADMGAACCTDLSGNIYLTGRAASTSNIATLGSHQPINGGGTYEAFLVKFNGSGVRQWGTYYGDTGDDLSLSCKCDANGNVYMAGQTSSTLNIATLSAHQTILGGAFDAFLVKFNSSGVRQWGTYNGDSGFDGYLNCNNDINGNVYLVGRTNSTVNIATSGATQTNFGGGPFDAFLVKFNSSGVRQWGTYCGGVGNEMGESCSNDTNGNVYMAGYTQSTTNIATSGAYQTIFGGSFDAFLVKFNSAGVRQWGTYYGDSNSDFYNGSCVDANGNVYLTGYTSSTVNIATSGAYQTIFGGGYDGFLVKFSDCAPLNPLASVNNVVCNGATINFTAAISGTASPTYNWSGPDTFTSNLQNPIITNASTLNIGTYTLTINNNGCVETTTTQITAINPSPTISVNSGILCSGKSFTIIPSGANTYTYQGGSAVVSPTTNATYTVIGTNSAGCQSIGYSTSTLSVNANPTLIATVSPTMICVGNSATLNVNGASSYTWNPGGIIASSTTVAPFVTTTYTVIGTNTSACSNTQTVTLIVVPSISVNATASSTAICLGSSATLAANGASTYTWYPGAIAASSAVVSPFVSTTYTLIGTNASGCTSTRTINLSVTPNITVTATASSTAICVGGSATLTANGASNYTWYPGAIASSSAVVSPPVTTIYTVTGTNALACSNTTTIYLVVYPSPPVNATASSTAICAGGSATLTANGASTYTWYPGAIASSSAVVSPIVNTTYTVAGSNASACTTTQTINITVNAKPSISVNSGVICSGNSFTLSPSGANTYTYSSGTNVVSPLTNTSYSVTGTSALGCVGSNTAVSTVSVNATPIITVNSGVICSGQSFTLIPSGASTYTYSSGTNVVSPLLNTSYSVTGTSALGCVGSNTAVSIVSVNAIPIITVNSGVICSGNSFTLSPSGANTYTYSSGTNVVNPLTNTSYSVMGTSALGCIASSPAVSNVTVNASPIISITNGTLCNGSTYTLNPIGALSYTYSSGTAVVSPSVNTTYSIIGTNALGCVSSNTALASITVYQTPSLSISSASICSGNVYTLNPSGAFSYSYSSGSALVSPIANTNYTISGTSIAGCAAYPVVATLSVYATPSISVISGTVCSGQNFTLTPSGASTYSYSSGSLIVNPSSTTVYSVVGTSNAGCISSVAATPTVYVNPLPMLSVSSLSVCSGQSYTLNPSGAASYTYSSGSAIVSPSSASNYTITGSSAAGCLALSPVVASIGVYPLPLITVPSGSICQGNSFILNPTGAVSYTFSGGSAIVSPTATSTYSVQGTNAYGCVSSSPASAVITVYTLPTISVNSGSICSGKSFTMVPSGALTYTYSSGTNVVSPLTNSSYSVTGTSALGCVGFNTAVSNVIVNATPSITVNSGVICSGQSFTLIPGGASTYTYSSGTNVVSPLTNSSYSVTGTSVLGCVASNTALSAVNVYATPIITVNSGVICSGKSFTLVPSGASTYTYSSGTNLVSPLTNTSYSVTGTSASGCVGSNTAVSSVTVNTTPSISVNSGVICSGNSFTLIPSGASTYTYSSGSSVVSPLTNTSYSVSGTSASGCLGSNTAVSSVTVNTTPSISVNSGVICSGKSFTMMPSGANTYTYSSGTNVVSPLTNSSYSVTGTSALGCVGFNTAVSNVIVNATPSITVNSGVICSGNSFTLIPNGANTYTYSSGTNVVSPLTNTSYSVSGTSALGCIGSNTAVSNLTVNATPTLSVNSGDICAGQSFTLLPSGAATYSYSSGSNIVSPSSSSTYSVYGKALNGCQAINPAISALTVNPLPNVNVSGDNELCVGETTKIKATGASSYTWNTGATTASIMVQPIATVIYTVTGLDQTNCTKSQTIEVSVSPCTALDEVKENSIIKLYPNPNHGKFVLEVPDFDQSKIAIYNYLGQLIYEAAAEEQLQIDISAYANGMYTLMIQQTNKEPKTMKFIKQ